MNVQKIIALQKKIYPDCTVAQITDLIHESVIDLEGPSSQIALVTNDLSETKKISYHIAGHENAPINIIICLDVYGIVELSIDVLLRKSSTVSCSIFYTIQGSGSLVVNASFVHQGPHSKSAFLAKGVVNDRGTAHVLVKTVVTKEAIGADALQTIKHLMLSDHARVTAIPILEALNDQIACKHGSSIGSFDPDVLFFLQSKGFDIEESKKVVIEGFFI